MNLRQDRHVSSASISLLLVFCLALGACARLSSAGSGARIDLLPERWTQTPDQAAPQPVDMAWWRGFDSRELDGLIELADRQSHDIAAAVANLRQAQAGARAAGAARWPALDLLVSGERTNDSSGTRSIYGANLTAAYELDAWGKVRAAHDSALANVQASLYDARAVRLGVLANVANAWLEGVALRERIAIAELDRDAARRTLTLVEGRRKAGAATELDVARQRGILAERDKSLAVLHQRFEDARVLLARLLGEAGVRNIDAASLDALALPRIDAGLPSALLLRRPDLARAEAQLAAADADLVAARAALLPSVNLSAVLAGSGGELLKAMENPAFSLLAAIGAPIFNAGRLSALRDGAEARRESLLAAYRSAVVAAFSDSQNALNMIAGLDAQYRAQQEILAEAERAWRLADVRYRAGAIGMLDLLDTQRTLYSARADSVQIKLARLQASVSLFRALGGGWERELDSPP